MKTEIMKNPAMPEAPSIMHRGVARNSPTRTRDFTESLSAASRDLAASSVEPRAAAKQLAIGEFLRNPATVTESASTPSSSAGRSRSTSGPSSSGSAVVTPFGNRSDRTTPTSGDKHLEWRDYFRTHAPSQWWTNETARGHFREIYGDNALVTLDWTCNVPENNEPAYVIHVPLDPTGKPIPGSHLPS